ncbi:MAG: DNA topoisomerase IV subunit A [Bacilli bacterium]
MEDVLKRIQDYSLEEIMGDRFGKYSKYIIQDRAIPDVRDGLKPVQRRILYAMYKNKNTFEKKTVKSAQTVGEVIGKYHPHGDTSVYDAMIRMSQDWKQREPYIIIQGNNGSIDGDCAAAYRYTEAKLSKISNEMLRDIEKDAVEMVLTFDDSRYEPTVLPAKYPNLLVNGSTGISAGYATNIPTHNLGEVIDATIKRLDSPNCKLDTIMEIIKGPDFPTGGIVEGIDGIRQAYETGRGKINIVSKYEIVKNKGKQSIVITEIPYEVTISQIVKKIEDIRIDKKIDGIAETRNETGNEGLRIVIELKAGADPNFVVNYLLKNTDMQISYNFNMVAIVNRRPKLLGIMPMLDAYIAHQKEVITRKTKFDLDTANREFHITEGLVKALSILDDVIRVIRASKNKSDAEQNLVKEFGFTEEQARAIVTLQLYRLTNFDVVELQNRMEDLKKIIAFLTSILEDENVLIKVFKDDLKKIKKEYGNPRRSVIKDEITEIKIDEKQMLPKENVIVVITNEGYVKRVSSKSYAAAKDEATLLKPGDYITGLYELNTLDTILLFTNMGRYLYVPVYAIPEVKWKELGKHITNVIQIAPDEKIISSIVYEKTDDNLVMFTKNGQVKRSTLKEFEVSRYSKAMTAFKLKDDDDELVSVVKETDKVLCITKNGYYLMFNSNEIPVVGIKASGVKGINLKDDSLVAGITIKEDKDYINIFTNNKTAKRIKISDLELSNRSKRGSTLMKKVKSFDYQVLSAYDASAKDIICIKADSEIREEKNSEIPIMDLASTGSNISKYNIDKSFVRTEMVSYLKKKTSKEEQEEIKDKTTEKVEPQELTIDDFIDDFKL